MRIRTTLLAIAIMIAAVVRAQQPQPDPAPVPPEPPSWDLGQSEPERQVTTLSKRTVETNAADLSGANGDLWLNPVSSPFPTSVLLRALSGTPDVFAQLGTNTTASTFRVLNASGATLMRVFGDGGIALGASSTAAGATLAIGSNTDGKYALNMASVPVVEANTTQNDFSLYAFSGTQVQNGVTNSGSSTGARMRSVLNGPGTLATSTGFLVEAGVNPGAAGTVVTAIGANVQILAGSGSVTHGYGVYITDVPATTNSYGIFQVGTNDKNYFGGNVGLGTTSPTAKLHVVGNIVATGSITGATVIGATYQDIAEWVPATSDMAPGTVVVLNRERTNEVMPSSREYDTSVAGVVSANPGVILGTEGSSKEQIATTGRVRVRVDATAGPIAVGDLLVTSNVSGTAMKSVPIRIGDASFHRPGTIVGKALEPLASGVGEILVLLSLQ